MRRLDALAAIYDRLASAIVVTIMGALPAERQAIGQNRPQLLHQVKREARPPRALAMQEPNRGIQTHTFGGAAAVVRGPAANWRTAPG